MTAQIGQSRGGAACSWQVWVTDPKFPALTADAVNVPLAPSDRLPVSLQATFRIGYTGLLQSKIYAFGETKPGDIRDLASAPSVDIPVDPGPHAETIFLAMARQPAPLLEALKTQLAGSGGRRRSLGWEYSGVGMQRLQESASVYAVDPGQVVAKDSPQQQTRRVRIDGAKFGDLAEKCLFTLMPAQSD
jgi:hypothetical protein